MEAVAALVFDGESRELVGVPVTMGEKRGGGLTDARTAMALKSHSEAERRRRERINGHLTTLRRMTPCTDKLDKAGLLAEVISHIKKLKADAVEASNICTIPSDADELSVEVERADACNSGFSIKASLCCEDRPELLADLKQAMDSLHLKTLAAEMSTLGGRFKFVFVGAIEELVNDVERHVLMTSIHQALKAVIHGGSSIDFLPNACFPGKRRKVLPFESSSSSS
ncbi:hypothetical protein HPP92_002842 [Vanilla planifolia]|uniref:BHLH domain-containing protein n=1 Tax=Vanilla planifolia TaxID=51239 RepID=A0A835S126_VANPL|nr:hypothetical protein HPP92_002842 [Vanilla planifolia]